MANEEIGDIPVLQVDFPDTTRYYGDRSVNRLSRRLYQEKVLNWSNISRKFLIFSSDIIRPEFTVEIDDNDKEFANLLASKYKKQIRRSAASLNLVGSSLADFPEFTGVLATWGQFSPHKYRWVFRQDDEPLERKFPKTRITELDWPNADSDAIGKYAPILLGSHSSVGESGGGMVPTYNVDTVGFRYTPSVGYSKAVTAVYDDGGKVATSDYAITYPIVNGRTWTLIDFTSAPTGIITADVDGYDENGDGTGDLIIDPVKQLEHVFENFIWGDYRTGSWQTGNAPIADNAFETAIAFANNEGYEGAIRIAGDQIKGRDFFNNWLKTWDARAYWTRTGDLAVLFLNHAEVDFYKSGYSWLRWEQHEHGYSDRAEIEEITKRITIRYVKNSVENALKRTLEVNDLSIDEETSDSVDLVYGPARLV